MNVPYPDIPQAGLFSRLRALLGMAARVDRLVLAGGGQTGCVDGMEDTDILSVFIQSCSKRQKARNRC